MGAYLIQGLPCLGFSSEAEVRSEVARIVSAGKGGYSVAINAEKLVRAKSDPALREVITSADLPVADGFMAVLALRWIHGARSIKVDLPRCVLAEANARQWRLAVCGAAPEVNRAAAENIRSLYPGINIVVCVDGYRPREIIGETIAAARPHVALLAMGSPLQEILASGWRDRLDATLVVGCGGALDILAGRLTRAPAFFVENGLEWLYRLVQDPRRLRRQLVLPVAAMRVFFEGVSARMRHPLPDPSPARDQ